MDIVYLKQEDPNYPAILNNHYGKHVPKCIALHGNINILRLNKLALFCSIKCPGNLILQALDLAQALRKAGITVIGGFHSPMEREVLKTLLRSPHPIIICPARSINRMRLPKEYKRPIAENRLLLLSPFDEKHCRITVETSNIRNKFVAALSEKVFVAYAAPGSKTEQFCKDILASGKTIFTLKSDDNKKLIELGAKPKESTDIKNLLFGKQHLQRQSKRPGR